MFEFTSQTLFNAAENFKTLIHLSALFHSWPMWDGGQRKRGNYGWKSKRRECIQPIKKENMKTSGHKRKLFPLAMEASRCYIGWNLNPRLCSKSRMASTMGGPICVTFSANTAMWVYRGTLSGNSFWISFVSDSASCWRVFSWFCDFGFAYSWTQTSIRVKNSIWDWRSNINARMADYFFLCFFPIFLPQLFIKPSPFLRFLFTLFTHLLPPVIWFFD